MNEFRVYLNGCDLKFRSVDKKLCYRKAKLFAKNKLNYVELVYVNCDGLITVIDYWN